MTKMNGKMAKSGKYFVETLSEMANNSTIHGLPNINRNKNKFIKTFWILCFLCSFGYCSYALVKSFFEYFNYSVTTQISFERNASVVFPTVTFCNKNRFKLRNSSDIKTYIDKVKYSAYEMLENNGTTLNAISFIDYDSKLISYSLNMSDIMKYYLSHSIDEMLFNCKFNNYDCGGNDFEYFYSNSNGNCFKFNSGKYRNGSSHKIKTTSTPGRRNALILEFFIEPDSIDYDLVRSTGIQLYIHDHTYTPLTDIEGLSISAGFETNIVISRTNYQKKPAPFSSCVENTTSADSFESYLFKTTVSLINNYNQKYCLQLCYQKHLISACGCFDVTMPSFDYSTPCNGSMFDMCIYKEYVRFYQSELASACFDDCPEECEKTYYNYQLSYADFPTPYYMNRLQDFQWLHPVTDRMSVELEDYKNVFAAVNIYYDDVGYTLIQEAAAKTADGFIADIGGISGLCLGTSLLSVAEIFEFLWMIFYYIIKHLF